MKAEETSFSAPEGRRAAPIPSGYDQATWTRCAVAPPRSNDALGLVVLGLELADVEVRAFTHERAAIVDALALERTRPTPRYPAGYPVGDTIAACGRQHAFKRGPAFKRAPLRCRSRPCPACARHKADVDSRALAAFIATRPGARVVFFTLTQPKRPRWREQPRAAADRIQAVYRRIFRAGTSVGRWARALFVGGLRSIEVTYSRRGDKQNDDGTRTKFSGYHVHLHGLLELAPGVHMSEAIAWLRDAWVLFCPGASTLAQKIFEANAERIRYVCKYVTKGMESASRHRAVVRELYHGMSGARLLQASGLWMGRESEGRLGWREIGDPPLPPVQAPWLVGPTVGWVARLAMIELRPQGVTTTIVFRDRATGDEHRECAVAVLDALVAAEAAARSERAARAALRRPGPPRVAFSGHAATAPPPS